MSTNVSNRITVSPTPTAGTRTDPATSSTESGFDASGSASGTGTSFDGSGPASSAPSLSTAASGSAWNSHFQSTWNDKITTALTDLGLSDTEISAQIAKLSAARPSDAQLTTAYSQIQKALGSWTAADAAEFTTAAKAAGASQADIASAISQLAQSGLTQDQIKQSIDAIKPGWNQQWSDTFKGLGLSDKLVSGLGLKDKSQADLSSTYQSLQKMQSTAKNNGEWKRLDKAKATSDEHWEVLIKGDTGKTLDSDISQLKSEHVSGWRRALSAVANFIPGVSAVEFAFGKDFITGDKIDRSNPLNIAMAAVSVLPGIGLAGDAVKGIKLGIDGAEALGDAGKVGKALSEGAKAGKALAGGVHLADGITDAAGIAKSTEALGATGATAASAERVATDAFDDIVQPATSVAEGGPAAAAAATEGASELANGASEVTGAATGARQAVSAVTKIKAGAKGGLDALSPTARGQAQLAKVGAQFTERTGKLASTPGLSDKFALFRQSGSELADFQGTTSAFSADELKAFTEATGTNPETYRNGLDLLDRAKTGGSITVKQANHHLRTSLTHDTAAVKTSTRNGAGLIARAKNAIPGIGLSDAAAGKASLGAAFNGASTGGYAQFLGSADRVAAETAAGTDKAAIKAAAATEKSTTASVYTNLKGEADVTSEATRARYALQNRVAPTSDGSAQAAVAAQTRGLTAKLAKGAFGFGATMTVGAAIQNQLISPLDPTIAAFLQAHPALTNIIVKLNPFGHGGGVSATTASPAPDAATAATASGSADGANSGTISATAVGTDQNGSLVYQGTDGNLYDQNGQQIQAQREGATAAAQDMGSGATIGAAAASDSSTANAEGSVSGDGSGDTITAQLIGEDADGGAVYQGTDNNYYDADGHQLSVTGQNADGSIAATVMTADGSPTPAPANTSGISSADGTDALDATDATDAPQATDTAAAVPADSSVDDGDQTTVTEVATDASGNPVYQDANGVTYDHDGNQLDANGNPIAAS